MTARQKAKEDIKSDPEMGHFYSTEEAKKLLELLTNNEEDEI